MTDSDAASIRAALRSAVIEAMKRRDQGALAAYRTALGAIDNPESIPLGKSHQAGAIELSAGGPGRTDVQRRLLTDQDMIDIVLQEAADRRAAAESLGGAEPDAAQQLRHEASLLQALAGRSGAPSAGEHVTAPERPPGARLRVATLNLFGIRADWNRRRDVVRAGFADLNPDVVSLQEVIKTADYDQARDVLGEDYHIVHHTVRLDDGQGDSIASRWPITAVRQLDVPDRDQAATTPLSSTLLARIDVPQSLGPGLLLANHATQFALHREADREYQAVVIAGLLEREAAASQAHVIVAGDRNAQPGAASIRYWTGAQPVQDAGVCYRDAWQTLHPAEAGHTFTPENTLTVTAEDGLWSLEPGRRIDYILVRCNAYGPTLRIDSCRRIFDRPTGDVWASDHFGVTADLVAPTRPRHAAYEGQGPAT